MIKQNMEDLKKIAKDARLKVLEMIYRGQTSHIGSNMSCIELLAGIFEKADLSKDRIILSCGWKAAAFYYFLAQKGIIPWEDLDTFCQKGSKYIGLTEPGVKGVDFSGGSMGMGFPAAVGFALAKKIKKEEGKVYVIMSDGELGCGSTWEAACIARQHKLNNLVVIIDANEFQAMGKTKDILEINPQGLFYGFNVAEISGHHLEGIKQALEVKMGNPEMPYLIYAHTVKGYGVSFMAGNNDWHYLKVGKRAYNKAKKELCS
jgi:transketolase